VRGGSLGDAAWVTATMPLPCPRSLLPPFPCWQACGSAWRPATPAAASSCARWSSRTPSRGAPTSSAPTPSSATSRGWTRTSPSVRGGRTRRVVAGAGRMEDSIAERLTPDTHDSACRSEGRSACSAVSHACACPPSTLRTLLAVRADVNMPAAADSALIGARANPNCCSRIITGASSVPASCA